MFINIKKIGGNSCAWGDCNNIREIVATVQVDPDSFKDGYLRPPLTNMTKNAHLPYCKIHKDLFELKLGELGFIGMELQNFEGKGTNLESF